MVKFTWQVALDGYRWKSGEDDDGAFLEPVGGRRREYAPLDEFSGLFRCFADLKPTMADILVFANRFGNLGAEVNAGGWAVEEIEPYEEYETFQKRNELLRKHAQEDVRSIGTLGKWSDAINKIRKCVEVWDNAQERGIGGQSMREVQMTINDVLDGNQVRVAFEENPKLGRLALQIIPKSLLGAFWVQFALAVAGDKSYRKCRTCGLWYELAPEINRISKYYCSEGCRSRAYRTRKERARRLATEGKSPQAIADELGSDLKTVQGWLKRGKG